MNESTCVSLSLTIPLLHFLPISSRKTEFTRGHSIGQDFKTAPYDLVWNANLSDLQGSPLIPDLYKTPPHPKTTICFVNSYSWPWHSLHLSVLFLGTLSLTLILICRHPEPEGTLGIKSSLLPRAGNLFRTSLTHHKPNPALKWSFICRLKLLKTSLLRNLPSLVSKLIHSLIFVYQTRWVPVACQEMCWALKDMKMNKPWSLLIDL